MVLLVLALRYTVSPLFTDRLSPPQYSWHLAQDIVYASAREHSHYNTSHNHKRLQQVVRRLHLPGHTVEVPSRRSIRPHIGAPEGHAYGSG